MASLVPRSARRSPAERIEILRHPAHPPRAGLQPLDELTGLHGGAGQGAEPGQDRWVQAVERARRERVRGQEPDQATLHPQRAAEARVHVGERGAVGLQQAVEGIRQRRVGRKANGIGRAGDHVQPRVLAARIDATERIRGQSARGHRDEELALRAKETGGVAGNQRGHGVEQPAVAILGAERSGQVQRDREQLVRDRHAVMITTRCPDDNGASLSRSQHRGQKQRVFMRIARCSRRERNQKGEPR